MRKALLLLLLLPMFAFGQIPAANDTTLLSGSTAFTPQFRFTNITLSGVNYRIPQVYNSLLGKYDTYVTTKYLRAFYAPAVGGGYAHLTGGNNFTNGFQTFEATGSNGYAWKMYKNGTTTTLGGWIQNTSGGSRMLMYDHFPSLQIDLNPDGLSQINTPISLGSVQFATMGTNTTYNTPAGTAGTDSIVVKSSLGLKAISASSYVPSSRTVSTGVGLLGGGNLGSNLTLYVDTANIVTKTYAARYAPISGGANYIQNKYGLSGLQTNSKFALDNQSIISLNPSITSNFNFGSSTQSVLDLVGGDSKFAFLNITSYSGNSWVNLLHANGTAASPTTTTSGQSLGQLNWFPYDGVSFDERAYFEAHAGENFDATHHATDFIWGHYIIDPTTGTQSLQQSWRLNKYGNLKQMNSNDAYLSLKAGTATTGTAPFKMTPAGASLLATPESGAWEMDASGNAYYTDNAGTPIRHQIAATNVDNTFSVAQSMPSLSINGTGGNGFVNMAANNVTTVPTPSSGFTNVFTNSTALGFKNPSGFGAQFNSNLLTGNRGYTLPDAGAILMTNPLNTAGDIPYLSANSTTGTNVARLGIGANGTFLQVQSGLPAYFDLFGTANTFTANQTATRNFISAAHATYGALEFQPKQRTDSLYAPSITYTNKAVYRGNGTTTPVAGTITDDGTNVGIGSAFPAAKLDVFGDIKTIGFSSIGTGYMKDGSSLSFRAHSSTPTIPGYVAFEDNSQTNGILLSAQPQITGGYKTVWLPDSSGHVALSEYTPKIVASYKLSGKTNVGTLFTYSVPADGVYRISYSFFVTAISTNTIRGRMDYTQVSGQVQSVVSGTATTTTASTATGNGSNTIFLYLKGGTNFTLSTENVATGGSQTYDAYGYLEKMP